MFKVVSFSCIFILYEFKSMPSRGNGVILIGLFSLLVIVMSCRKHQMYYFDDAQLHDYSNSRSIVINCTLTKGQNIVWNCCISLLKTVVLTSVWNEYPEVLFQNEMQKPANLEAIANLILTLSINMRTWYKINKYYFLPITFYLPQEVHAYEQSTYWRNTGFDIC